MMGHRAGNGWIAALAAITMGLPAAAQDASRLPFQRSEPQSAVTLKPGANSFFESQARQLLETKGYSDISTLRNDSDGIWRGTARKADRRVDVSVDFQGHVAEK